MPSGCDIPGRCRLRVGTRLALHGLSSDEARESRRALSNWTGVCNRVIAGCLADDVAEIVSLANTLKRWRTQILAHHATGASNGPTEAMNLLVKKIKRCGHGFTSFTNYRLRVLLHCGGIKWKAHPATTMRARSPQLVA